jgi:hypothetical protein
MVAVANKGLGAPQTGERGPKKAPRRFWRALLKAIHDLIRRERYEPAKHYMRGPGPASSLRAGRTKAGDE